MNSYGRDEDRDDWSHAIADHQDVRDYGRRYDTDRAERDYERHIYGD